MLRLLRLCAAMALLAAGSSTLLARIQDGSADLCWSPDNEWPVPCDDGEE